MSLAWPEASFSRPVLPSKRQNPTVVAAEQKLAAVDGAEQSLLFASGMAAISTALLTLLKSGDEVICCSAIYGGTFHIIEDLLPRLARRYDPHLLECMSPTHKGDRKVETTYYPKRGERFYCPACREEFQKQRETSVAPGEKPAPSAHSPAH